MSYGFVVESWRGQARSCIIACLCKEIRPEDLRLIPGELFIQENVREWLRSAIHGSPPPTLGPTQQDTAQPKNMSAPLRQCSEHESVMFRPLPP